MEAKELQRNTAGDQAGIWIDEIPEAGDLRLRVRSLNSPIVRNYRARLERNIKPSDRTRGGQLKPEVTLRIMADLLGNVVLLEWDPKTFTANGEPIPYTKETALKYLHDPVMHRFHEAVVWAANEADRLQDEVREQIEGNSQPPSPGS